MDVSQRRVWLALPREIVGFDLDGNELARIEQPDVERIATGPGGLWAATRKELVHLDVDGNELARVEPFGGQGVIVDLVVTWDGDVWTADANRLARVTADGEVAQLLALHPPSRIWQLGHGADVFPPKLEILAPVDGSCGSETRPEIVLSWSDVGSGVDADSAVTKIDQLELEVQVTWQSDAEGAVGALTEALLDGAHSVEITIQDRSGNTSEPATAAWTVDTVAPQFVAQEPADGLLTNEPPLGVSGLLDEVADVTLQHSGGSQTVSTAEDGSFAFVQISLGEGTNVLSLGAVDCAENTTVTELQVTLDTIPPAAVDLDLTTARLVGSTVMVLGSADAAEPGSTLRVSNLSSGGEAETQVAADGSFSVDILGIAGDTLRLVLTDPAGNEGEAVTITVQGDTDDNELPPDPATVAPPNDETVATDIASSTSFLYAGPNPILTTTGGF